MGAKQSKRSVDISGKEAEGAREVAAGAGGEGRLEPLADADTLKPQLNGDAHHIHTTEQQTDKEKQLDNGTPENEKDATTEKENKEMEKENETEKSAPITNGDGEAALEPETVNGSDAPAAGQEVSKKPKKEKVKKKWSLRSISFSRKDKPKQDKKQKEEEPKANGETEKVPEEETALRNVDDASSGLWNVTPPHAYSTVQHNTPENAVEAEPATALEETKKSLENGDEKTPETPDTEPLTNGSSTPESPKADTPQTECNVVPTLDSDVQKETPKSETASEPHPINGVPSKDSKDDMTITEAKSEEINSEETPAVAPEVPAPENSVQKEVCVEQMSLIEPTPPPLPASPPPSSVASFAETTMASPTEQNPLAESLTSAVLPPALTTHAAATESISASDQLINESSPINTPMPKDLSEHNLTEPIATHNDPTVVRLENEKERQETSPNLENLSSVEVNEVEKKMTPELNIQIETNVICGLDASVNDSENKDVYLNDVTSEEKINEDFVTSANFTNDESIKRESIKDISCDTQETTEKFTEIDRAESVISSNKIINENEDYVKIISTDNNIEHENIMNKNRNGSEENETKAVIEKEHAVECNGNVEEVKELTASPLNSNVKESVNMATTPDESIAASIAELPPPEDDSGEHREDRHDSNEGSESFPAPPSDLDSVSSAASPEPQEPLPVSEKLAELSEKVTPEVIADITTTVESVTLQETSTDVAVAN